MKKEVTDKDLAKMYNWGAALRLLRKMTGLGLIKFGYEVGYFNGQICNWENNKMLPDLRTLYRYCFALNVPLSFIAYLAENENVRDQINKGLSYYKRGFHVV